VSAQEGRTRVDVITVITLLNIYLGEAVEGADTSWTLTSLYANVFASACGIEAGFARQIFSRV